MFGATYFLCGSFHNRGARSAAVAAGSGLFVIWRERTRALKVNLVADCAR